MKVYTYSEARQRLAEVLNIARDEEVVIKRRGGEAFSIIFRKSKKSPFDVPGIQTKATTKDILTAVRESRERFAEQSVQDCRAGTGGFFAYQSLKFFNIPTFITIVPPARNLTFRWVRLEVNTFDITRLSV